MLGLRSSLCCLAMVLGTPSLFAAQVVEKSGRFEINWSTSTVRFYGTSLLDASKDDSWRIVEQRAWGDGINYVQSNLPAVMATRTGLAGMTPARPANALSSTNSVNTTYYGDSRIKVTLEGQLPQLFKQILTDTSGKPVGGSASPLALRLSQKTTPTAVFAVVDENGSSLLSSADMAATVASSSSPALPRWYKGKVDSKAGDTALTEIKASVVSPGVLKVARADWRPEYAAAIASGQASVVLP